MIKEIFDVDNTDHVSSGKFSISSIGSCWRKMYYSLRGEYKDKYDAKTLRTFGIGDAFHRLAVKEIMEKGHTLGISIVAAEVVIPEQKYISGRSDIIVSNGKKIFVVDIKSCGDWVMKKAKAEDTYIDNYKKQVQLYLHYFGIETGYLLFYGKHRGETHEVKVEYDKDLCLKLIKEVEDFFHEYVEKNIAPPKCNNEGFGCSCCYPELNEKK